MNRGLQHRIENLSIPEPNSGCWIWLGAIKNKKGYGGISLNGRPAFAHRAAYIAYKGQIPARHFVIHSCDNTYCVNPDHLRPGTPQQNSDDMKRKGRNAGVPKPRGENNGAALLTEDQVGEINRSMLSTRTIASRYSVSRSTIKAIRSGQNWAWLTGRTLT